MIYEWDDAKNRGNVRKHGVSFDRAEAFDWESALVVEDKRRDYGEPRFVAVGPIADRLYVMAFAVRAERVRIISLRKANKRECQYYAEAID